MNKDTKTWEEMKEKFGNFKISCVCGKEDRGMVITESSFRYALQSQLDEIIGEVEGMKDKYPVIEGGAGFTQALSDGYNSALDDFIKSLKARRSEL